jgi:hypothetical protein
VDADCLQWSRRKTWCSWIRYIVTKISQKEPTRCHRVVEFVITMWAKWLSHRSGRQLKTYVKPEARITVFELLMIGGVSPQTCWAIKKHLDNKFHYTLTSCFFCEIQGEKRFLFVINELKFGLNVRGDQRTVLVKTVVFIQSLQLRKNKNYLAVD